MSVPVLSINNITIRGIESTIFSALSFQLNKGEHWALVGQSGSGKSAMLQTIAGKFNVVGGTVTHHFFDEYINANPTHSSLLTYHQFIAMVSAKHSFRNLSNTGDFYYQQRYNALDADDAPTVDDYLKAITPQLNTTQVWTYQQTLQKLNLEALRDKHLIKLSNGETKRLLIAAALLKHPSILLLDNPLTGLDVDTRKEFNTILATIAASGISIVMATAPDEIPDSITHVAILHERKITYSVPRAVFNATMVSIPETKNIDLDELSSLLSASPVQHFTNIVKMDKVTVSYGENVVLNKVNWHISQGEHWALLGPNGAGKSSLLSLINGDNPQAYANNIILFDRKRGSGESIWDIKSKIGFVSPELYQYFPTDNSCLQVIESGFYDTLGLFRQSDQQKAAIALRWMKMLELETNARTLFKNVSASTQRLCLLARALVKNPPLLIFDEPCQGLDSHQQLHFKHLIDAICSLNNITLIYVSHYQHELPNAINHVLRLNKGSVVV